MNRSRNTLVAWANAGLLLCIGCSTTSPQPARRELVARENSGTTADTTLAKVGRRASLDPALDQKPIPAQVATWSTPDDGGNSFFIVPDGGAYKYLRSPEDARKYVASQAKGSVPTVDALAFHLPSEHICEIAEILKPVKRKELALNIYRSLNNVDVQCLKALNLTYLSSSTPYKADGTAHKKRFFALVQQLSGLRGIGYSGPGLSNAKPTLDVNDLTFRTHPDMRTLVLRDVRISTGALATLTSKIEMLAFQSNVVDSLEWASLPGLPRLRELRVVDTKLDKGLGVLAKISGLEHLTLRRVKLGNQDVKSLRKLDKLVYLDVSYNPLGPEISQFLVQMKELKTLRLSTLKLTDKSLVDIATLLELEILDIDRSKITDVGMVAIGKLTKLRELDMWGTDVGTAGVKHLSALHNLRSLSLESTKVDSNSLAVLATLKELRHLNLSGTFVRGHLADLAPLSHLESLSIESNDIGNKEIAKLPIFPALRDLELGQMDISEAKLEWLEKRYPKADIVWIEPGLE